LSTLLMFLAKLMVVLHLKVGLTILRVNSVISYPLFVSEAQLSPTLSSPFSNATDLDATRSVDLR